VAEMAPPAVPLRRRLVALPRTTSATYRKLHRLQTQLDVTLARRHRGWELFTTLPQTTHTLAHCFFF